MTKKSPTKNKRRWPLAIVALLLLCGAAWALRGERVDPAVAELEALRSKAFADDATDSQRQAFRDQVRQLTDEQRQQFFQRSRPDMRARIAERMDTLFELPPDQLQEEARARAAEIVAARKERAARPEGERGGPPWGGGQMSEAQRDQFRKQRLDFVDAGTRGQMSEFRRMVDQQLEAMGQEPSSGRDMRAMMGGRGRNRG
ncbi:hypothetical protein [Botrimarina sp.]|uniref:hypothetical protein n=1 Tax=Botrimarina sp. TaxID=2795802 RepID=UPI0032EEA75D